MENLFRLVVHFECKISLSILKCGKRKNFWIEMLRMKSCVSILPLRWLKSPSFAATPWINTQFRSLLKFNINSIRNPNERSLQHYSRTRTKQSKPVFFSTSHFLFCFSTMSLNNSHGMISHDIILLLGVLIFLGFVWEWKKNTQIIKETSFSIHYLLVCGNCDSLFPNCCGIIKKLRFGLVWEFCMWWNILSVGGLVLLDYTHKSDFFRNWSGLILVLGLYLNKLWVSDEISLFNASESQIFQCFLGL